VPEAVSELDPKTQLEFVSIAPTRRLNATGGIRSDQLKRVVDLVENVLIGSGDSLRRRKRCDWVLVLSSSLRYQDTTCRQAKCVPGSRRLHIADRGSLRFYEAHASRRAFEERFDCLDRYQAAAENLDRL